MHTLLTFPLATDGMMNVEQFHTWSALEAVEYR